MITRNSVYQNAANSPRSAASVRDACRILFRHKRKMAITFCATLAVVIVGLAVWPRTYKSEARLLVRLGKESVGLDPTASLGQTVGVEGTRDNEINSEIEILRSRVLLEDVVSRIGHDVILNDSSSDEASSLVGTVMASLGAAKSWLSGEVGPVEQAVNKLEKSLRVSSPRQSNVIVVSCSARDSQLAQRILKAYLESYQVMHVKATRTSGSYDFFVDQSELVREQLTLANEELRDAKNKNGLASVEGQRQNVQAQANSIELALLENERAVSSSEAKIAALRKTLAELPEQQLAEEIDAPSLATDTMRNELYKVQILEKEASSRYTALHPTVIALRRQVEETRKILAAEESRASHKTKRLSPVHQSVQTDLAAEQATAAARQAESSSLKQQFDAVQSKIRALNDNELRITELSRKVELLEASYRNYATNREQARIDQALELGRISNVNVVQPASLLAKPSNPRLQLTLLVGLFLATVGAVLVAFVAEYFDPSLRTSEQTERELGIPVLFAVPRDARAELLPK
jgi:uncharacterized protein involved in exopolysaccharide biosynthesis